MIWVKLLHQKVSIGFAGQHDALTRTVGRLATQSSHVDDRAKQAAFWLIWLPAGAAPAQQPWEGANTRGPARVFDYPDGLLQHTISLFWNAWGTDRFQGPVKLLQ
jgi:hypothetical protein